MEKKRKKLLSIIGDIAFIAVMGFVAVYAIFNGIDKHTGYKLPFFGTRSSVIVTQSMSFKNKDNTYLTDDMEQIQINDVVTTKMEKYEDIDVYEVITFYANDSLICHRVVDKYENESGQYLVTRGDANNADDEPVNFDLYRGTVIKVTPGAGKVVGFFKSPYFYLALCGTVFFVALGFFIYDVDLFAKKVVKAKEKKDAELAEAVKLATETPEGTSDAATDKPKTKTSSKSNPKESKKPVKKTSTTTTKNVSKTTKTVKKTVSNTKKNDKKTK